jgi:hypothetical protein
MAPGGVEEPRELLRLPRLDLLLLYAGEVDVGRRVVGDQSARGDSLDDSLGELDQR